MTTTSTGFTLTQLLAVLVIIAVLVAIMIPVIGMVRAAGFRTNCLNNQRSIVIAMNGYAVDQENHWPALYAAGGPDSEDGRKDAVPNVSSALVATTVASFELLAAHAGGALSPTIFADPANRWIHPERPPIPGFSGATALPGPGTGIDSRWLKDVPSAAAYAYDWSVPSVPSWCFGSMRVVLADRPQDDVEVSGLVGTGPHRGYINVAYSDGHTGSFRPRRASEPMQPTIFITHRIDGVPYWSGGNAWSAENRDAEGLHGLADNIFDAIGDYGPKESEDRNDPRAAPEDCPMLRFGHGSTTRSWVK